VTFADREKEAWEEGGRLNEMHKHKWRYGSPSPLASSLELVTDEVLTTMIDSHKGIEMHD